MAKRFLLLPFSLLWFASCQKNTDVATENTQESLPTHYRETIKRMVEVTKAETQRLKALTAQLRATNSRTTSNGEQFAQQQLQNYCEQLLAIEP